MKNSTPVRIARDPAKPSATDKTNVAVIAIRSMFLYQFIFSTNLAQTAFRARYAPHDELQERRPLQPALASGLLKG
jgi:hypothetical protein